MAHSSDRNLLFGILALQMDFVTRQSLIDGMQAWLLDKGKPLGELLVERGALTTEHRSLLEPLVDAHVRQHGGEAQQSLAALSSDGGLIAGLAKVDDGELQASLSLLPQPEHSGHREVGWQSSVAPFGEDEPVAQGEVPVLADGHVERQPIGTPGGSQGIGEGDLSADPPADPPSNPPGSETLIQHTLQESDQPKLRFRILRPHAEGGLGRVFVALDRELNREVAFKEIKPQHSGNRDARTRFVVEAEVTGGLEHPGIVPVYGLGHFPDGRPFYAMRFIRGESLHEAIREFHRQREDFGEIGIHFAQVGTTCCGPA